jgi:hypothetical protein
MPVPAQHRPAALATMFQRNEFLLIWRTNDAPPSYSQPIKRLGKLLVGHKAREIDLHAAMIEKDLAANCGWHV